MSYPASQPSGCAAFNPANAALLAGKVALLDWTDDSCGSRLRVDNAAGAGAVGVILVYNHPALDIGIFGGTRIPSTLTTQAIGQSSSSTWPMASV